MDGTRADAIAFDAERSRLTAIAARILGSDTEADDVLQEAWLRRSRTEGIDDLPAWLTTVVTRLCLDHLRKRRTRADAEEEPPEERPAVDPATAALLDEQLGGAVQLMLDALTPTERVALVLHDVFSFPFDEVGTVLGRSETAVRQLASRARRKVVGGSEPREARAARAESRRVVDAFLAAARGGELATLLSLLAPGAVMRADLVGQQMGTDAIYDGADAVAARLDGAKGAMPVLIDGDRGAAWIKAGTVQVAFVFHVAEGRVQEVELIADPEVLATLDVQKRAELRPTGG